MLTKSELIADLYESILSPEKIPDALTQINNFLDCDGIHLVGKAEGADTMFASVIVGSQIAGAERAYLAHYFRIDPRLEIGLNSPCGVAVACHDFLDEKFVSGSEFYQDFLIPNGPRYVIGGSIYRRDGKNINVAINHLVGRPAFSSEKRESVSEFMYHLSRWANQLFIADEMRGAAVGGFFALDTLGQGILILDDQQRVLYSNKAVTRLLGDIFTSRGFRRSWVSATALRELVVKVSTDRQARSMTAMQSVGGKIVNLLFSLLPLPRDLGIGSTMPKGMEGMGGGNAKGRPESDALSLSPNASVMILVRAQQDVSSANFFVYQQGFGLTPAEARLAEALANGWTPKDYAAHAQIGLSTVRTHIRALLAKTRSVSLRELVVLLCGLPRVKT